MHQKGDVRLLQVADIMEGRIPWKHKSMICSFWEGIMDENTILAHNHLWIPGAVPAQAEKDVSG